MSQLRLPYAKLSPETYQGFLMANKSLGNSALGQPLIEMVNLRVSQINGCAYCLEMHAAALRAGGMAEIKLDSLAGWRVSSHFSERERGALAWAESLTHISTTGAPDEVFEPLKSLFTDGEIADLTFAVALINAFNRLAIGMRQ
ncbi:carboxymuconolactone decarboxylase family protein [Sodalis sp. dw_96]|uniref:carboxymuconolactone decarboxylase family protein n=1 Tax=Sodalis sp. dw_96 TaxID=2719794 RepID=UPI001BD53177|nr:carboxymuconolactone decarboxylase family protein [Sodalis sp. dw_96]